MALARIIRRNVFLIIFALSLLSGTGASAQPCPVHAPQYSLTEDTVSWSMTILVGRSCIQGVRFGNVHFESLKLVSPPQSGKVELLGSGFIYSPKADFQGQDSFSLAVLGSVDGKRGSSTIQVTVLVSRSGSPNAAPPTVSADALDSNSQSAAGNTTAHGYSPPVSFTAPSNGATVSGSLVNLTAAVSDAVESVQFVLGGINVGYIIGGENVGATLTSPPYATVWDSTRVADGSYMLHAVAKYTSGNYRSSSVFVTVKNK